MNSVWIVEVPLCWLQILHKLVDLGAMMDLLLGGCRTKFPKLYRAPCFYYYIFLFHYLPVYGCGYLTREIFNASLIYLRNSNQRTTQL